MALTSASIDLEMYAAAAAVSIAGSAKVTGRSFQGRAKRSRHMWLPRYGRCFLFVPQPQSMEWKGYQRHIEGRTCPRSHSMLLTRSVLHRHREIAAVVLTYAIFLTAILVLAWVMA